MGGDLRRCVIVVATAALVACGSSGGGGTGPSGPLFSATTPKGAVLTHRNVISNIEVEVRHFGLTPKDRMVHHLPMNHVGGATEITMGAFVAGTTLFL